MASYRDFPSRHLLPYQQSAAGLAPEMSVFGTYHMIQRLAGECHVIQSVICMVQRTSAVSRATYVHVCAKHQSARMQPWNPVY